METSVRRPLGRVFLIPLIVLTLAFGWLAYASTRADAPPAPQLPKLELGDLLLAAAKAKGIYLAYDNVTGPAGTDHTDHAPALAFSWGASRPFVQGGGGGSAGKLNVSSFNFQRTMDKYSAGFLKQLVLATHAPKATLYLTNATVKGIALDYLEFEIDDAVIESDQISGGGDGDLPTESLSLTGERLKITSRLGATQEIVQIDLRTTA